jgi:hypothetical protein
MIPPSLEPALYSSDNPSQQCFDLRVPGPGFSALEAMRDGVGTESDDGLLDFEQAVGEALFVPSSWWHQVLNLEPTLSINHNW